MTGPLPALVNLIDEPQRLEALGTNAARFIAGLAHGQPGDFIANSTSRAMLLTCGEIQLPVTVEDGAYGHTYVASPHSAYVLYAKDEIELVGLNGAAKLGGKAALGVLDRWLKAVAINRTVHIDNWLLSTSLHGRWDGAGIAAIRRLLVDTFPDHLPVIRCVDRWSSPQLVQSLEGDGWMLVPSRQIWVTDDLERDWKPRSHTKSDRRSMRKSGLQVEELDTMTTSDAKRIADLHAQLYLDRYSSLNPAYTPAFVQLAHASGALRWRVARNAHGAIMASAGMRIAGDIVTVPMLGYDTTRPQSEALYRIASLLSSEWVMERGFRHHGSAGAGTFKSNRGAHGIIEHMAIHTGHLPASRRLGLTLFAEAAQRIFAPTLQKQGW